MKRKPKNPGRVRIRLTHRAWDDLQEIEHYSVREWGRAVANFYLDAISAALDRLKANPQLLSIETGLSSDLHLYRVQKHWLVCDSTDEFIVVVAVIHTSMDVATRLLELEPRLAMELRMLQARLRDQREC